MTRPTKDENSVLHKLEIADKYPSVTSAKQQIRAMLDIPPLSYPELDAERILHPGMTDIKTLNAFRDLRNKLFENSAKDNFILMVSSLIQGGGTSYMNKNLAAAIALDFERTALLIDCDITKKSKSRLFPNDTDYGLTEYLENVRVGVSDIIYASGIPRLRVCPIGSEEVSSTEFFSSDRMEELLAEIKERYKERFIILDAPPINNSPDARVLANLCDQVILVAPYGRATKLQINAGIQSIPKEKYAGIVLNN